AGLGDAEQDVALLFRVALDGVDEVGDQVGPALVLVEHLGPCGLRRLVRRLDRVVAAAPEHGEHGDEAGKPEQDSHRHQLPLDRIGPGSPARRAPARRVYRSAPRVVRARSGPSPAGEASAELRELGGHDHAAVALRRVVLVEARVVGLGRVVRAAALDAGDDGRIEYALGLQGGDHVAGGGLLLRVLGEDRRAALGPDVVALAVRSGRVVDREEDLEEFAVADAGRIEAHLHHLGVAGGAAADRLVARVRDVAAAIARLDVEDAIELEEAGF